MSIGAADQLHPICCIEDCLKICLEEHDGSIYTLVCDLDRCWCVPEEVNEFKCGVNISINDETSQDIDTIGDCGPGTDSITVELSVEIYAFICEGSRRKAKKIHGLIQRILCDCWKQIPIESLSYVGMSIDTKSDSNEVEFTVLTQLWTIDYSINHCSGRIIRPCRKSSSDGLSVIGRS